MPLPIWPPGPERLFEPDEDHLGPSAGSKPGILGDGASNNSGMRPWSDSGFAGVVVAGGCYLAGLRTAN
jgi:hypothetical protein